MVNGEEIRGFLMPRPDETDAHRTAIDRLYNADEAECMNVLLDAADLDATARERIDERARSLVQSVRDRRHERGVLDAFMQQYDLSSEEGVVLMCLAEALLRLGNKARLTEYQGVAHDSWEFAYRERGLVTWLLSQRRAR